uniref:Uncharacterized protein n=1 Tax=Mycena chlorophos TaxID=658473 RepID=A0ABQ0LFG2_MYCCL|nr:predicted protein [Mycena chlorophos]
MAPRANTSTILGAPSAPAQPRARFSAPPEASQGAGTAPEEPRDRRHNRRAPGWVPKPCAEFKIDETDVIKVEHTWRVPHISELSPKLRAQFWRLHQNLRSFGHYLPLCQFIAYVECWGVEFAQEVAKLPEKTVAEIFAWGFQQARDPDLDYDERCAYLRGTFALEETWDETELENKEHNAQLRRVVAQAIEEGKIAPEQYSLYVFALGLAAFGANGERLVPALYGGIGWAGHRDWEAMLRAIEEGLPMFDAIRQALDALGQGPSFAERSKQHELPPVDFQKRYGRDSRLYLFSTGEIQQGGVKWRFSQQRIKNVEGKEWSGEVLEICLIDGLRGGGRRDSINRSPLSNHKFPVLPQYTQQAAELGKDQTIVVLVPKYTDDSANDSCRLHIQTIVEQQQLAFNFRLIWLGSAANPQDVAEVIEQENAAGTWLVGDEVLNIMRRADASLPTWADAEAGRVYACPWGRTVVSERLGAIVRSFGGGERDRAAEKAAESLLALAGEIFDLEIDLRVSSVTVGGRMAVVVRPRKKGFRVGSRHVTTDDASSTRVPSTASDSAEASGLVHLTSVPSTVVTSSHDLWLIVDLKEDNPRQFTLRKGQTVIELAICGQLFPLKIVRGAEQSSRQNRYLVTVPEGEWDVTLCAVRQGRTSILHLAHVEGVWTRSIGDAELLWQKFETVVVLHELCVDVGPLGIEASLPGQMASFKGDSVSFAHLTVPNQSYALAKLVLMPEGPKLLIDGSSRGCPSEYLDVYAFRNWSWSRPGAAFRHIVEVLEQTSWWKERAEKIGMRWSLSPPTPKNMLPDFDAGSAQGYFALPVSGDGKLIMDVTAVSGDLCAALYAEKPGDYVAVYGCSHLKFRVGTAWLGRSEVRVKWVRAEEGRLKLRHEGPEEKYVNSGDGNDFVLGDDRSKAAQRLVRFFKDYFPHHVGSDRHGMGSIPALVMLGECHFLMNLHQPLFVQKVMVGAWQHYFCPIGLSPSSSMSTATSYSQDDGRPAQYTFKTKLDDDDDQSNAEDVFAFVPPSAADGSQQPPPLHEYPPLEYPAPTYNPSLSLITFIQLLFF